MLHKLINFHSLTHLAGGKAPMVWSTAVTVLTYNIFIAFTLSSVMFTVLGATIITGTTCNPESHATEH